MRSSTLTTELLRALAQHDASLATTRISSTTTSAERVTDQNSLENSIEVFLQQLSTASKQTMDAASYEWISAVFLKWKIILFEDFGRDTSIGLAAWDCPATIINRSIRPDRNSEFVNTISSELGLSPDLLIEKYKAGDVSIKLNQTIQLEFAAISESDFGANLFRDRGGFVSKKPFTVRHSIYLHDEGKKSWYVGWGQGEFESISKGNPLEFCVISLESRYFGEQSPNNVVYSGGQSNRLSLTRKEFVTNDNR